MKFVPRASLSLLLVIILSFLVVAPAAAETIYVGQDANYTYNTIQAGIDAASPGDTVIVADGTYTGPGNRDIDFGGLAITVRSETGPENCIIDCNGSETDPHRGFTFHSSEDANSVLDGFTITNGYFGNGGGINCYDSSPTIANCIITENISELGCETGMGGGIYCANSGAIITKCTISSNLTANGGGIGCSWDSNVTITDCNITGNSAAGSYNGGGGGIACSESNVTVKNCAISENSARYGGGIYCGHDSNMTIVESTISQNVSDGDDGGGGGIACGDSTLTIVDCTITGNLVAASRYSGHGGGVYCVDDGNVTIAKSTITHNLSNRCGGGIYCNKSNLTVTNCIISENSASSIGGGLRFSNSDPTVTNCTIAGNSAGHGAGIGIYGLFNNPTFTNCTISGNSARGLGGGISCKMGGLTTINCTITGNSAQWAGGGIGCEWDSSVTIVNSTISSNSAAGYGGGIYGFDFTTGSMIANSILWGNAPEQIYLDWGASPVVIFSDIQGGWPGDGNNIDIDPCFVEPGYWADINDTNIPVEPDDPNTVWVDGDYHLLPTSPCIDTGTNDPNGGLPPTDLDDNPRPADGDGDGHSIADMGAYEFILIQADLRMLPRVINRCSRGRYVLAIVHLPEDIDRSDIDRAEPLTLNPGGLQSTRQFVIGRGWRRTHGVSILAFFNKAELIGDVPGDGKVELELEVFGKLKDGRYFRGSDTVRLIHRPRPHHPQGRVWLTKP